MPRNHKKADSCVKSKDGAASCRSYGKLLIPDGGGGYYADALVLTESRSAPGVCPNEGTHG
jgi:hypothetical protein